MVKNYIQRRKLTANEEKRDSRLYGIAGFFSQKEKNIDCMAFGGYFRYDVLEKIVMNGQMIDPVGPSMFDGTMDKSVFDVKKKYIHEPNFEIGYHLEKHKDGIWYGDYYLHDKKEDKLQAKIWLIDKDAFTIACGTPQKFNDFLY